MTINPNNRQVGGTHYRTTRIQHWDVMLALNADYFTGVITKYLARYPNKDTPTSPPLMDLEKALHYLEKYKGVWWYKVGLQANGFCSTGPITGIYLADAWLDQMGNKGDPKVQAIYAILSQNLDDAERIIKQMIEEHKSAEPTAKYIDPD